MKKSIALTSAALVFLVACSQGAADSSAPAGSPESSNNPELTIPSGSPEKAGTSGSSSASDAGGAKAGLCEACSKRDDCAGAGSECVTPSNAAPSFCAADCSSGGVCREGYSCVAINDASGAVAAHQCVPQSGHCSVTPVASGPPNDGTDAAFCVSEVNRFRATIGKAPLTHSSSIDAYSATAAQVDGTAHSPHKYFAATHGGGVSMAQNEIPWWNLPPGGTVTGVIKGGLQMMWDEGPGGGHYENMSGDYTEVGCGIFVNGNEVTVTHDFH